MQCNVYQDPDSRNDSDMCHGFQGEVNPVVPLASDIVRCRPDLSKPAEFTVGVMQ